MLNLIGNLFLQYGHFQNKRDIPIKINSKLVPVIDKKIDDRNPPIKLSGMDKNKHSKENLRSFIIFFILYIIHPSNNIELITIVNHTITNQL
ncbi:hypothetical protein DVW08_01930 [Clostridium botulinum]|nr:hypothetical protein [Clostridium botulinum]